MPSTQPGSPAVQPLPLPANDRKTPSWGCLIALAIALFILVSFLYSTWKVVVAFDPAIVLSTQGRCQITASRVQQFTVLTNNQRPDSRQLLESKTHLSYTLFTADGRTFQGSNYDWMDDVRAYEWPDQAIVNQYRVGHTYACWYNPLFPALSALRQNVDWSLDPLNHATFPFIVGGFVWVLVLLVGLPVATIMTGILIGSRSRSQRKAGS